MNTKIIAILMTAIVSMALIAPMAIAEPEHTTATVGNDCPEIDLITITPDNDSNVAGVQVRPNPCPANKTVTVTVDVSDDNGPGDIQYVRITSITPNPASSPAMPVTLTEISNGTTTATYEGTFDMGCCDVAQNYTITVVVSDNAPCLDNDTAVFTYLSISIMSIDFSSVDYGIVVPCNTSYVFGDSDMSTPGLPTIHNNGNDAFQIYMHATNMTPGPTYIPADPGNVDMQLDVNVPGNGTSTPGTPLPVCTDVYLPHWFECCNETAIDFSIHVPVGTAPGDYTGELGISMT